MSDKKIVVIFPGVNYSADCPLLYYAVFKFETRGYEKVAINYGDLTNKYDSLAQLIQGIKSDVLLRLKDIDLSQYDDIVFVSKSMGTAVAGWIEEKLCIKARHIYLTPLNETLPYIKKDKNIITVIAGTKDKFLDTETLKEHCKKENIYLKLIEGAGHRLEVRGDMNKNIELLKEIVSTY
ncbi:hypothetical protein [Clostridium folliculivorans]|uniref:Alpha/beta hydrolase n=1 Tax=Clostridium folliculivorans TaxID=2886038 RepID=A0A9W6DAP1_9CLOT|nr:hypothetical protein [Clostridium folliculivorans]GKU25171.1 alpha/beta hydrolase [Clostridium folliculivorans]GKU31269.1 alpha/beta hydrolase [Clostridium folliculivorans]